jgi:phage N-6-adenine-methyltransferase
VGNVFQPFSSYSILPQEIDPKRMDIAAIVREARTSSGLSQSDLARRAGVSIHAVWELENRGNGTVDVLSSVVAALDLRFAGLPRGKTFAEQVRTLRGRRGWSQERLAERAGVSPPAIMRLERGNARIATLSAVLAVLAPKARVRRSDFAAWRGGNRDCRFTPRDVIDQIVSVIGLISLDPAGHPDSPVVASKVLTEEDDGLSHPWIADTVYCNPPYSRASAFLRKAFDSWKREECRVLLMLLPAQTHTVAFHECAVGSADVFLLKGRIAFEGPDGQKKDRAPFPNMFVLYGADEEMVKRMLSSFDCVHLPRAAAAGRREHEEVRSNSSPQQWGERGAA